MSDVQTTTGSVHLDEKSILIVDDDEVDRTACRRALSRHGFGHARILEADMGENGLLLIWREHPDIVLLDYRLPDADGIQVLRQIASPSGVLVSDMPSVVMMTGAAEIEVAVEAMRLGARDYLVKDTEMRYLDLLPEVLDRILEERVLRAQMLQAREALQAVNQQLELSVQERAAELFAEREQAMITLASIADAVFVLDNDGRVRQMNPAAERITGENRANLIGCQLSNCITFLDAENRRAVARSPGQLPEDTSLILVRRDGSELVVKASGGKMRTDRGEVRGMVIVFHDITREHARSHALMYQATHDPLTDLPNRLLFADRLSQSINHADHNNEKLAVVFLDLDGFKNVNDTFGHHVGDHLLRSVAIRLQGCIRESDSLARLAGDEFTMVVSGKNADQGVQNVASKVIRELTTPFDVDGNEIQIGTSVGISIFPDDGASADELMEKADAAMYEAKMRGGSAYRYYSAGRAD